MFIGSISNMKKIKGKKIQDNNQLTKRNAQSKQNPNEK